MPTLTFKLAYQAAEEGNIQNFNQFFNESDVNEHRMGTYGHTMLGIACSKGHLEIVKLLLNCKGIVDVNKGKGSESPLYMACCIGHLEIVKLLLNNSGIDVNMGNGEKTPLEIASEAGRLEIVKLLLQSPSIQITKPRITINGKSISTIRDELKESEKIKKSPNIGFFNPISHNTLANIPIVEKERVNSSLEQKEERNQRCESTFQLFTELCLLNEKVSRRREQVNSLFKDIISLSNKFTFSPEQEREYSNIVGMLNSCTFIINTLTSNNANIENEEHVSQLNNIMLHITKVVETINSEHYVIKLNNYCKMFDEKLQILDEFKQTYLNQDLKNEIVMQSSSSIVNVLKNKLSEINSFEIQSKSSLKCVSNQLQGITTAFNSGTIAKLSTFSNNLINSIEMLEMEYLELQKIGITNVKKLIPDEIQTQIHQLCGIYQSQSSHCNVLIQDIPFIIEKHQQLQNVVHIMNNYKQLSEQYNSLQRKKSKLTRELNVVKLEIDLLKDEFTHNELVDLEDEIKEKETVLLDKKRILKECIEQTNEIKLKFLQLKTIGFDMQSVLKTSIFSSLNIEEMSADLFKEIKPIQDFNGNHHLFIGIDINDKKHVIKQYTIKNDKKLESLQKELKITNKLKHNNIIDIEGFYMESNNSHSTNNVYIVMPFYSNGNLKEFIEKQRKSNLTHKLDLLFWERTWRQLLIAIQHVHSKGVIHCDIKPENIFVGELNNGLYPIILGDFDISLDLQSRTMNLYTRTAISGTYDYLAPELMNGQSAATFKSDMFAFGKTIKNCMTTQELKNYLSLNNLVEQCLRNDVNERPFASDALVCEFFLKDTLLDEIKVQEQVKSISNQSKQLKEYEQQLNQLKSNMKHEKYKLEKEIKELEKKSKDIYYQNSKEREEISNQISKLKYKEMKLKVIEMEMEKAKSRKFNITLPSYWKINTFTSYTKRYYIKDVTKHLRERIQGVVNISCNSATLGSGRDQQVRMNYSKLIVSSVQRIENATLFTSFKSRMNHLSSYQDPVKIIPVQTEQLLKTSKSFEWMKTVGLNSSMNEKYLWHGTKPDFVQTIAEHGFDERVASLNGLFGAGVYFAEFCSKSDQYCTPDQNGEYTLFLCRVVLGRKVYFTPQQMNNHRRPPEITNSNKRVYDCVIGQSNLSNNSYREFIVYDRYQCYPEYIIKYKRQ